MNEIDPAHRFSAAVRKLQPAEEDAKPSGINDVARQVAAQYRKIRAAGQLTPGDDRILDALRAHGLAAGL